MTIERQIYFLNKVKRGKKNKLIEVKTENSIKIENIIGMGLTTVKVDM